MAMAEVLSRVGIPGRAIDWISFEPRTAKDFDAPRASGGRRRAPSQFIHLDLDDGTEQALFGGPPPGAPTRLRGKSVGYPVDTTLIPTAHFKAELSVNMQGPMCRLGIALKADLDLTIPFDENPSVFGLFLGNRDVVTAGVSAPAARKSGPDTIRNCTVTLTKLGCQLTATAGDTELGVLVAALPTPRAAEAWCVVAAVGTNARFELGEIRLLGVTSLLDFWSPGTHSDHPRGLRQCVRAMLTAVHRARRTGGAMSIATHDKTPNELWYLVLGNLRWSDFYEPPLRAGHVSGTP